LADDFQPDDYRDEYRERVVELIETKRRGEKIKLHTFEPEVPADSDSLESSLRMSLKKARA
jgi:DNA end-binding protein Ku